MTTPMITAQPDLTVADPNLIAHTGVIVTGASSGLGRATALLVANAAARLLSGGETSGEPRRSRTNAARWEFLRPAWRSI